VAESRFVRRVTCNRKHCCPWR